MLNSIVMAQSLGAKQKKLRKNSFHECNRPFPISMHWNMFKLNLRHRWPAERHSKSYTPSLLIQGTQATPASSALKIASPGLRPSWVWYLAQAPALSAVAGNPVPALTQRILPNRKKNLWASAEETVLILLPPLPSKTTSNCERRFSENLQYRLFNDWHWKAKLLTNDLSKKKTKSTNRLLTDQSD